MNYASFKIFLDGFGLSCFYQNEIDGLYFIISVIKEDGNTELYRELIPGWSSNEGWQQEFVSQKMLTRFPQLVKLITYLHEYCQDGPR